MIILSADTSCDESCVAIIDTERWRLLADVVHSHASTMRLYGGVVPEIASREHLKALPIALGEALNQAGLKLKDIDWFTVTNRPGLIGALLVGVTYIKTLAYAEKKPFTGMDHIEGHLYSPLLSTLEPDGATPPPFPWIALVVSGGHSELFLVRNETESTWLGGTLDDAAGEAFDKVGKLLGLGYPAGPEIDRLAREGGPGLRDRFSFPKAQMKDFQFSFSGLKTSVLLQTQSLPTLTACDKAAIAASAQEAILGALVDKARKACEKFQIRNLVVTGGVACNSRLRELLPEAFFPKPKHCSDNAAMIASLSAIRWRAGKLEPESLRTTATAHL